MGNLILNRQIKMKFAALLLLAASASGYDHRHPPKKLSKAGLVQIMDTSKGETSYDDGECPVRQYFGALWGAKSARYQKKDHSRDHGVLARAAQLLFDHHGIYDQHVNDLHTESPLATEAEIAAKAGAAAQAPAATGLPTAMFHGLGDACIMPGDGQFDGMIKKGTGAYVRCIEVGLPSLGEVINNFESVAQKSCAKVAADKNFHGEFNVIGLSQGGLLARYIAEECDMPGKVRNIVTLGGPHMGVEAVPGCFTGFACNIVNAVVKKLVYTSLAQNWIAPAGYFRDVANVKGYLKGSVFLPALNNENQSQNAEYAALRASRFSSVNAAMFVMFDSDSVIYPKQTAWFQALDTKGALVPLKSSDFYLKDYIGLKALMDADKVQFEAFAGDHLQFTDKEINDTVIPFLLK